MAIPVHISADSTVDLSSELVERFGITVLPMLVTLDGDTRLDGIEVVPQDLFAYTQKTGQLAKTAAQSSAYYIDRFRELTQDGGAVIHFTISASMSSAYNFACLAAEEFENVYVVDSMNLSTGIALLVLKAAEMAADGADAETIVNTVNGLRTKVDASFVVDTLEFLHKGGRCSTIAMLGANVLKLKPSIQVKEGAMDVGKKYRGRMDSVLREYVADALHDPDDIDLSRIFVTHTCGDDPLVGEIVKLVRGTLPFREVLTTSAGCTVSAHCGPGTLGVLFIRKSDK